MSRALLDVNVLVALLDASHVDHGRARGWLTDNIEHGWASCAITQNGFVRILSQPRYPRPVATSRAAALLAAACDTAHHDFWACDVSLLDGAIIDTGRLHGPRQVTDSYLLALAVRHAGRFVTFDESVALSTSVGAKAHHLQVI